jgi:antirestriction protein ArdC
MSAAQWRQVGRYPARGSTALRIWAPRRVTEHKRRAVEDRSPQEPEQRNDTRTPIARDADGRARFLLVPVFDVAQTDGEPLPQQPTPVLPPPGHAPDGMWDALVAYANEAGYAVAFGETGQADGTTNFSTRQIAIAERGSELSRTLTLAHEIGHMSLHADPEARQHGQTHRGRAEVEAESVAYLVAADYGLAEAYDWHYDYLSHWSAALTGNTTDADATREAIRQTAGRVMAAARPVLTHLRELSVGHPDPLTPAPAPKPPPVVIATVTR